MASRAEVMGISNLRDKLSSPAKNFLWLMSINDFPGGWGNLSYYLINSVIPGEANTQLTRHFMAH